MVQFYEYLSVSWPLTIKIVSRVDFLAWVIQAVSSLLGNVNRGASTNVHHSTIPTVGQDLRLLRLCITSTWDFNRIAALNLDIGLGLSAISLVGVLRALGTIVCHRFSKGNSIWYEIVYNMKIGYIPCFEDAAMNQIVSVPVHPLEFIYLSCSGTIYSHISSFIAS